MIAAEESAAFSLFRVRFSFRARVIGERAFV